MNKKDIIGLLTYLTELYNDRRLMKYPKDTDMENDIMEKAWHGQLFSIPKEEVFNIIMYLYKLNPKESINAGMIKQEHMARVKRRKMKNNFTQLPNRTLQDELKELDKREELVEIFKDICNRLSLGNYEDLQAVERYIIYKIHAKKIDVEEFKVWHRGNNKPLLISFGIYCRHKGIEV